LLDQRGTHFDPQCVDAFLDAWPEVLRIRERFQDEIQTDPENLLPELQ